MRRDPEFASRAEARVRALEAFLRGCAERAEHGPVRFGELVEGLHEAGFAIICIVQSLPFLQPVSLGPVGTLGGIAFAGLGWQILRGAEQPWMPRRMREHVPSAKTWRVILRLCLRILRFLRRFTRPRLPVLVAGRGGRRLGGALIALSGVLMSLPVMVPLNNALPAVVILLVAVGELEDDGLMVVLALAMFVVMLAYFIAVFWMMFVVGGGVWDFLKR